MSVPLLMTPSFNPHPPVDLQAMDYLQNLHVAPNEVVRAMEAYAAENQFPIIGRPAGLCLYVMALTQGARRVFECGSGFGYSAYWFARAVGKGGQVVCTEGSEDNAHRAKIYLSEAGLWDRVDFRVGWAQKLLAAETGPFDVIYNDADKDGYPEIWELARTRIAPGGLYIADNCLWSCRVTQSPPPDERPEYKGWTAAIQAHNHAIASDPDFDSFLNPVRDGLIVARRRK